MKNCTRPAILLLLAIGALLVAGTGQTAYAGDSYYRQDARFTDEGQFVMSYSPTLGLNVGLVVTIDGRVAGAISKGHTYHRYLPAGRHVIRVARNGRAYDALEMPLTVRPGQTYSYLAKYSGDQVLLVPGAPTR